jgi:hypothetical protein
LPLSVAVAGGALLGVLPEFYRQVWQWGLMYAKGSAVSSPIGIGLKRSADWLAFHGALVAGVIVVSRNQSKDDRFKLSVWFLFSAAALLLGNHFAPRYFFQLLPVMVIAGARGIVLGTVLYGRAGIAVLAVLLLAPVVRFGPRYADLAADNLEHRHPNWSDALMDIDSQQAANVINARKHSDDTLFVWGYRPDMYVYTRLTPPGRFWDSQPLDGVPADRHLQSREANSEIAAQKNRAVLVRSAPTFVVDGLGLLNPKLKPESFPEIAAWLKNYRLIGKTKLSRIFERVKLRS